MPILDNPGNILTATASELLAPFNSFFTDPPEYRGQDFPEGFIITEFDDGAPVGDLFLRGSMLPMQPFTYGGKQQLTKEYYPGNPEPTVQVMGSREDNIKIKGRFKAKKYSRANDSLRQIPVIMQEAIDEIRQKGSLCRFSLGEFTRYGFIESCEFRMKTLADIEYEIDLFVIGQDPPTHCKIAEDSIDVPSAQNALLINAALDVESKLLAPPGDISVGLFSELESLVGTVASAVALVTNFVNTIITAGEDASRLANKALGLIKYAQSQCAVFKRRVSQLDAYLETDATASNVETLANEAKAAAQAKYVFDVGSSTMLPPVNVTDAMRESARESNTTGYVPTDDESEAFAGAQTGNSIESILVDMRKAFQKIAFTVPLVRHLVKNGDSLTKLSIKYYKTPDHWERIQKHNKLTSVVLVPGTVLEIPKL